MTAWHMGRSWQGHPLEDECPCPQEPCGLVSGERVVEECEQHGLGAGRSIRQSHPEDRCPGAPHAPMLVRGVVGAKPQPTQLAEGCVCEHRHMYHGVESAACSCCATVPCRICGGVKP